MGGQVGRRTGSCLRLPASDPASRAYSFTSWARVTGFERLGTKKHHRDSGYTRKVHRFQMTSFGAGGQVFFLPGLTRSKHAPPPSCVGKFQCIQYSIAQNKLLKQTHKVDEPRTSQFLIPTSAVARNVMQQAQSLVPGGSSGSLSFPSLKALSDKRNARVVGWQVG